MKVQIVYSAIKCPGESFSTRLVDEAIAADRLSANVLALVLCNEVKTKLQDDVNMLDVYIDGQYAYPVNNVM